MATSKTRAVGTAAMATQSSQRIAKNNPALLAGGNPQIAKADGDAPVQNYIAAMPGWKRELGRRLDALVVRTVPGVCKAVKWNSPFYGVEGQGWFLSLHCFTQYVKVAFFRGRCARCRRASQSRRRCAISTSTRAIRSTRRRWRRGSGRPPPCRDGCNTSRLHSLNRR